MERPPTPTLDGGGEEEQVHTLPGHDSGGEEEQVHTLPSHDGGVEEQVHTLPLHDRGGDEAKDHNLLIGIVRLEEKNHVPKQPPCHRLEDKKNHHHIDMHLLTKAVKTICNVLQGRSN